MASISSTAQEVQISRVTAAEITHFDLRDVIHKEGSEVQLRLDRTRATYRIGAEAEATLAGMQWGSMGTLNAVPEDGHTFTITHTYEKQPPEELRFFEDVNAMATFHFDGKTTEGGSFDTTRSDVITACNVYCLVATQETIKASFAVLEPQIQGFNKEIKRMVRDNLDKVKEIFHRRFEKPFLRVENATFSRIGRDEDLSEVVSSLADIGVPALADDELTMELSVMAWPGFESSNTRPDVDARKG